MHHKCFDPKTVGVTELEFQVSTFAVGADPDTPPTNGPEPCHKPKSGQKHGRRIDRNLFTNVNKSDTPGDTKIVDTKWVYVI